MLPLMLLLCGIRLTYLYGLVNAVLRPGTVYKEASRFGPLPEIAVSPSDHCLAMEVLKRWCKKVLSSNDGV